MFIWEYQWLTSVHILSFRLYDRDQKLAEVLILFFGMIFLDVSCIFLFFLRKVPGSGGKVDTFSDFRHFWLDGQYFKMRKTCNIYYNIVSLMTIIFATEKNRI